MRISDWSSDVCSSDLMIADLVTHKALNEKSLRPPILVHETIRILDLIQTLKTARGQLVIVINEFGTVEGLVTPIYVFEANAGDLPDEAETDATIADGAHPRVLERPHTMHFFGKTSHDEGLER